MKNILAIGTDGEEALFDGMRNNMNHAIHLRCFGHFRDNCKRKLQESSVAEEAQKQFLSDVFGRHHGDIFEKGNQMCNKYGTLIYPQCPMSTNKRVMSSFLIRFAIRIVDIQLITNVIPIGLVDADNPTDFYGKLASLEDPWNERERRFSRANHQPAFFTYINDQVFIK